MNDTPNHDLIGIFVAIILVNLDLPTVKIAVPVGIGIVFIQSREGHPVDRGQRRITVCIHTGLKEVSKTVL